MASRRYHSREPVYVSVSGIAGNYGFQTNLTTANQGELGQQALATASTPVVFGANRPKPPRAVKKDEDGSSISSFIDSGKLASVPAGWRLTKNGKAPTGPGDPTSTILKTVRVCVPVGTVKWAWDMPLETYNKIGSATLTTLGIEVVAAGAACWYKANRIEASGTPYSRPPRVGSKITGEGGVDSVSTFCSPAKLDSLPVGWSPID
jgi:hypothetical protein